MRRADLALIVWFCVACGTLFLVTGVSQHYLKEDPWGWFVIIGAHMMGTTAGIFYWGTARR